MPVIAKMGMATAIDPRGLSPDPPKPGRPKVRGWERATFTIKVSLLFLVQNSDDRMDLFFMESLSEPIVMFLVRPFFQLLSSDIPNP